MAAQDVIIKIRGVDDISKTLSSVTAAVSAFGKHLNNNFRIFGETKKFESIKNNFTGGLGSIRHGFQSMTDNLAGFSALSIGSGGPMVFATKGAMDFESKMADVRALLEDINENEFSDMQAAVKKMALVTSASATEAAEGLEKIVAAGFSAKDSIKLLLPTLRLAQAGSMDFANTSEILTNGVKALKNSFKDQNDEVGNAIKFSNMLSKGQAISTATVQDLGEAVTYGAGTLSGLKIPIQQVVAGFAMLADGGEKGSRGGVALSEMFSQLLNPAEKARKVLRKLGLDARNLPLMNMSEFISVFSSRLGKIKDPRKQGKYADILFGERGKRGFQIFNQAGVEKYNQMLKQISDATDDTNRIAEVKSKTFAYLFTQIKNAVGLITNEFGFVLKSEKVLGGPFVKLLSILKDIGVAFAYANDQKALLANLTPQQKEYAAFVSDFKIGFTEAFNTVKNALQSVYSKFKDFFDYLNIDINSGKFWGKFLVFTAALANLAVILGTINLVLSPFLSILIGIGGVLKGLASVALFLFPIWSELAIALGGVAIALALIKGVSGYFKKSQFAAPDNVIVGGRKMIPELRDVIANDFKAPMIYKYKLDEKNELKNYVNRW